VNTAGCLAWSIAPDSLPSDNFSSTSTKPITTTVYKIAIAIHSFAIVSTKYILFSHSLIVSNPLASAWTR
jgi:hypothetical protein